LLQRFNHFLDWFSNYFAHRKGLLPMVGLVLIVCNFILSLIAAGWAVQSNLLLHLGLIIAIFGFMIAWAL